jgi:hypothetical protein
MIRQRRRLADDGRCGNSLSYGKERPPLGYFLRFIYIYLTLLLAAIVRLKRRAALERSIANGVAMKIDE